jgi:hypothetical protein
VQKAAAKKAGGTVVMTDDERRKLVGTSQSLNMPAEPKIPTGMQGLEDFSLREDDAKDSTDEKEFLDADSFFNLPDGDDQSNYPDK